MENSKVYSKIIYTDSPEIELTDWAAGYDKGKVFLVTEENVDKLWLPKFSKFIEFQSIKKIVLPAGESNKKLESVIKIWEFLSKNGADRKSLVINIGGGMLTDLAGFAASTFKRGVDFINVPTTLLSQVDASVGGKTGINFNGLKNEIGTFKNPVAVIINTDFLETIDHPNFLSGFAEMIKHGLIKSTDHLDELKGFNLNDIDYKSLLQIIQHSVDIKEYFVFNDPTEKNIRKALNLGHTAGHAFESLAMEQNRPVLHGFAVAWGMIVELFLSVKNCELDETYSNELTQWLLKIYGKFEINESDFDRLFELMTHDKKNESGRINFTLISEPGKMKINHNCEKELIFDALKYYSEL
ncbi:3-dehydroquinate synthase [Mariniphaga anaerophila]|uniref:3-dehydroquinate synthase n=1 Tax=Mariniphaga anaerophila TaxID=1484053 RepID=A0A1M5DZ41_9BACT|nr:3-dehydroquinate synthase [Mariniphaga anaerophila]SHF72144.1 3-dehydroquinate synthase [Mariniphaga anaerophila]